MANKKESYGKYMTGKIKKLIPGYYVIIFLGLFLATGSVLILKINIFGTSTNPLDILINLLFLNGFVPTAANNLVVRGGWFIGTLVIFYLISPALFKIYNVENERWGKNRRWLFPLIIVLTTSIVMLLLFIINNDFVCANNSFFYFSAINQLGCFSIGFVLYDIYNNNDFDNIRFPLVKFIIFLIASIVLFYIEWEHAFIFVPSVFGLSCMYLYIFLNNYTKDKSVDQLNSKIITKIIYCGKISFSIFLVHTFIAFDLVNFFVIVLNKLSITIPHIYFYIILLPLLYILIYICSNIFNKFTNFISKKLKF